MFLPVESVRFYVSTTGRLARQPYWTRGLLLFALIGLVHGIIVQIFHLRSVIAEIAVVLVWPNIAITARRLHDIGLSGWWSALFLAPLLCLVSPSTRAFISYAANTVAIFQAIIGMIPGTRGKNAYSALPTIDHAL
jgi:uncharacterized membrane protein YhaH (DUF805 family)